jgi:hypothetical protein
MLDFEFGVYGSISDKKVVGVFVRFVRRFSHDKDTKALILF